MATTKITTNSLADSAVTSAKLADASVTSAKLASSISIGTLTITSGISGNVAFDTNTLFVDSVNNRIGIGTTSPTTLVDVYASATERTNMYGGYLTMTRGNIASGLLTIDPAYQGSAANGGQISHATAISLGTTNYPRQLFISNSNGNVGIGTTTPSAKLHVLENTANASGNTTVATFGITSSSASPAGALGWGIAGNIEAADGITYSSGSFGNLWVDSTAKTSAWQWSTRVGEVMRINDTGLGIGVTSPSARLHTISTTEQLRIGYDASNYLSATVSIAGLVTLTATGASAGVVLASPVTATAQPALSALTDTHAITRSLFDQLLMDPSILYLRDEFIAVMDNVNPFGELGWSFVNNLGSGTLRPANDAFGFGVAGLHTGAAFRNSINAQFDASNIIGGSGFIFDNGLNNSSTSIKTRMEVSSISGSFKFGFSNTTFNSYKTNRFFGLRYSLPATAWTATNAITLNEFRRPTVANGRRYYASVAGTTGGSEPTWPTASGGTVVDGTVTWTENGVDGNTNILLQDCPNTTDETTSTFVNTGIVAAANTWYEVIISFVSGRTWAFYINGVFVGNLTMSSANSGSTMNPTYAIETSTASAIQLSMDYFFMLSRGITRPA